MAADMAEVAAVLTAAEAAAFMEAEVASMGAAAECRAVAEDFRGEEALLAAEALAEAAVRLAAGVPQVRASAAGHSVDHNAAALNAVDNRVGHRRVGPARLDRVLATRPRWAAGARADSAAAAEATLGLRVVLATEGLMERGIPSAAGVAV